MSEWQKIETAPKDGTPILAYWAKKSLAEIDRYGVVCWSNVDEWVDDEGCIVLPPTHWMPLPAPPSADGEEAVT